MKRLLLKVLALYWTSYNQEEEAMTIYGPDNPRPLDPNDPLLTSPYAPHETGAVLRAQRGGFSGSTIAATFKMSPALVMAAMRRQLEAENDASRRNKYIHDARVKPGTK